MQGEFFIALKYYETLKGGIIMKFYDLEWLADKCGTENKYEITAKIAAEARRESEEASLEKGTPANERFISNVLQEIEDGTSPINASNAELEN